MRRRQPQRTCVGCRAAADKRELLRIVRASDGSILLDPSGKAPGRGAYLHRDAGCVRAALRRGALARALRGGLDTDGAARLQVQIEAEVRQ